MKAWQWRLPSIRHAMTTGASFFARLVALKKSPRRTFGAWPIRHLYPTIARLGSLSLQDHRPTARPLRREVGNEARAFVFLFFFSCCSFADRLLRRRASLG